MKTVYKIYLGNNDSKIPFLTEGLGDKVKLIEKGDHLDTLEVTIENSSDLLQVFYAGLFCGMDKAK